MVIVLKDWLTPAARLSAGSGRRPETQASAGDVAVTQSLDLSLADVERLLTEPSPSARAATAAKVARAFSAESLSPRERALANDIFFALARDAEVRVRRTLAEELKDHPELPRELALKLAHDVAEVAVPVLESALVLSDEDLVAIVGDGSTDHQAAIARRSAVSTDVARALVDQGNETVVSTLMGNEGAVLDESLMHKALDRFGQSPGVNARMAHRRRLPMAVAERLVTLVSETLRQHLVTHHELSPDLATDLVLQARERALIGMLADGGGPGGTQILVRTLKNNSRLTPTLIVRALCTGDVDFFECALSELAGIPVQNVHILIHDKARRGLGALWDKCRLPRDLMAVVKSAIDVIEETQYDGGPADRPRFVERVIERILTRYDARTAHEVRHDDVDWLVGRLARAQAAAGATLH